VEATDAVRATLEIVVANGVNGALECSLRDADGTRLLICADTRTFDIHDLRAVIDLAERLARRHALRLVR